MEGRGGSAVGGSGAGAAGEAGIIGPGGIVAHPPANNDATIHSARTLFIEQARNRKDSSFDCKESRSRQPEIAFDFELGNSNRGLSKE